MGRRARPGGVAHLLIVVALALGVLVMHGLGHPADPAEPSGGGTSARHAAMGQGPRMAPGAVHGPGNGRDGDPVKDAGLLATAKTHGAAPAPAASKPDPGKHHRPGHATDMTSLCLAVLSVWMLAVLCGALLSRFRAWQLGSLARFVAGLRPQLPPPRAPSLLQLSVLRI
ncbi:hypothetical protein ADL29_14785 [Streptomyces chattanoogensis]|uniref:Uncharacterized protein n=1 Tax=Streptomyces chattanoogensis TaxID=66876 RepID=A0A0N1JYF1_9ACTN|nr:hypothetical protein ADL29_14785 [Streptomyces chattanoogensis]